MDDPMERLRHAYRRQNFQSHHAGKMLSNDCAIALYVPHPSPRSLTAESMLLSNHCLLRLMHNTMLPSMVTKRCLLRENDGAAETAVQVADYPVTLIHT